MSENPLLPHRQLKELQALMLHCRELERKNHAGKPGSREALLAATSMQLVRGDVLSALPGDATAEELAPAQEKVVADIVPAAWPSRMALQAGIARGMKLAGGESLVLAYANAGTVEPEWAEAMSFAMKNELPLLLVVADATRHSRSAAKPGRVTWEAAQSLAKKSRVPVIPVDGEDAVAMYRVMQESALHARIGSGPAILWGMLKPVPRKELRRAEQPLARLADYLKVRGIQL